MAKATAPERNAFLICCVARPNLKLYVSKPTGSALNLSPLICALHDKQLEHGSYPSVPDPPLLNVTPGRQSFKPAHGRNSRATELGNTAP